MDSAGSIAFHDLQQGGRTRDLPYYCELARRAGSTLELGAGTGRVSLELADLTDLWANELDERLLGELVRRAEDRGLSVTPVPGDATQLALGRRFDLILASIGLAQIVGGQDERRALLRVIARHLAPTGVAVVAIADVDEILRECAAPAPPQQLRAGGKTFDCQQLAAVETEHGAQLVWKLSVDGHPDEPTHLTYHRASAGDITVDAGACGLDAPHAHRDPGDAAELGATYCVLRQGRESGGLKAAGPVT